MTVRHTASSSSRKNGLRSCWRFGVPRSRRQRAVVPDGTLAPLSPAKHMGLMERHDAFNALLAGFCDAHETVSVGAARAFR